MGAQDSWISAFRSAFHVELRAEAVGAASRGWPVLPGVAGGDSANAQATLDEPSNGGRRPVPLYSDWAQRPALNAQQAREIWQGQAHPVLLATGAGIEAVEVDAELGYRTATVLRAAGVPVPIIATPHGEWLFLLAGCRQLHSQLAAADSGVLLHAEGSTVPLPPSPMGAGMAHWRVKPAACGWQIPAAALVQRALLAAMDDEATSGAVRGVLLAS